MNEGKMCCLGAYALSAGFSKQDIKGVAEPHTLNSKKRTNKSGKIWNTRLISRGRNSSICIKLMSANDDPTTNENQRERGSS
jgi:hypothetical protein